MMVALWVHALYWNVAAWGMLVVMSRAPVFE